MYSTTASVPLHPPSRGTAQPRLSGFPTLLQTPSGLAILELQGTINLPDSSPESTEGIPVGRLEFPEYRSDRADDTAWMKRVYMYVGQHQRLAGEVKKLPRALAVVGRAQTEGGGHAEGNMELDEDSEVRELKVVEVIKYKLVFAQRPEPVGSI